MTSAPMPASRSPHVGPITARESYKARIPDRGREGCLFSILHPFFAVFATDRFFSSYPKVRERCPAEARRIFKCLTLCLLENRLIGPAMVNAAQTFPSW